MKIQKSTPQEFLGLVIILVLVGGWFGYDHLQQRHQAQQKAEQRELARQQQAEQQEKAAKKAFRAQQAVAREQAEAEAQAAHVKAIARYREGITIMDPNRTLVNSVADFGSNQALSIAVGPGWLAGTEYQQKEIALSLWKLWGQTSSADILLVYFYSPAGQSLGRVTGSRDLGPKIKLK